MQRMNSKALQERYMTIAEPEDDLNLHEASAPTLMVTGKDD